MKPFEIAKLIVRSQAKTGKGRKSKEVADLREQLNDLVGIEEARRLIAQGMNSLAK